MLIFGVLSLLTSAGAGAFLAWENRDALVTVEVGNLTWTGHLYAVLVVGALLACWFLLGAAFIQCRLAERRRARAARRAEAQRYVEEGRPAVGRTEADRHPATDRRAAGHRARGSAVTGRTAAPT